MRIEILDNGAVVATILASEEFAEAKYPGAWRVAEVQDDELTPTQAILQTIVGLEQEQLISQQRITRETIFTLAKERAAALGLTEAQLIAKNKGYAGLKALDTQIAALRAQL